VRKKETQKQRKTKRKQKKDTIEVRKEGRKGDRRKEGTTERMCESLKRQSSDCVLDLDQSNCKGKLFPLDANKTRSSSVHLSS
jgi:hypothetical protein